MSRFKISVFIALITLAFSIAVVGDALAGEKSKVRESMYNTKWEQINVGDEEGHVIGLYEAKGIGTNMQGKKFMDGWLHREAGTMDINGKAGTWSGQGYGEWMDKDGDKFFLTWEGRKGKNENPKGTITITTGTGKWQGIQGKGTFLTYPTEDNSRFYVETEMDLELPR